MCGIIGIVSRTGSASERAMEALRRLEYRGYDSAGIATLEESKLDRRRAAVLNVGARRIEVSVVGNHLRFGVKVICLNIGAGDIRFPGGVSLVGFQTGVIFVNERGRCRYDIEAGQYCG